MLSADIPRTVEWQRGRGGSPLLTQLRFRLGVSQERYGAEEEEQEHEEEYEMGAEESMATMTTRFIDEEEREGDSQGRFPQA